MGRPSEYNNEEHPRAAREMTRNGHTLSDIAEVFGVTRQTLDNWKNDHPEFLVALKLGREDASDAVERAVFQRATGYTWQSEKIVVVSNGPGVGSHVERVPITEHVPPDPTLAKYWLNNRRPADWQEKQALEHSGTLSVPTIEVVVSRPLAPAPPPLNPPTP